MTNKNFFKSILAVCLIAFTSVAAFISCEVGLGEAVDVAAPVVKIATPPTAAVIRDTFAIAGTWSDDGSIKSLEVTLKNTGTKKEYAVSGSFEQEANTKEFKGSWQAIVNPLDSSAPIPDGSYEATIKFSDNGSHTTTITKSFVIDNTPPIIVLTRPSTAADSLSSDTYGQTFTLEGQAADTNNVSLIEVEIYSDKDCTPESYLHTVPLANVPNSINLDVAKFEKGDTTNDYFKIYKDATTDGGAKDFYCKLIAYDGAERYPVEGERSVADEKGNAISTYYLYKDIATEILQNYKINIVYNMLNGTYDEEDSSRSAVSENVIAKLKEKVRTTGKFTLNPKNNPTFAVTGRSPLVLDGHDFDGVANNISDGSQVVIEVSPGLDGILLDEDSLKVYAIECDANGKAKAGASKIYPDTSKSESGTSYRFVTTIGRDKGFEIDKTYIFGVEGYDQSTAKNPIEPAGNGYGFRMAPSGKAPTLVVDTPESPAYVREGGVTKDGSVLKFSGTVAVEAGKPELKLYRGNNKTPIHEFNFENQTPQHVDREYVYTFEYECPDFTGSSAQSDFKLEASQTGNISEYKPTITVLYVKGEPTLKTTIKGPLVDADICPDSANTQNLDNINGNFDFEGTVSQKVGLYDVIDYDNSSWTFTGKDKNGAAKTETGDLAAAFAGKINTLNYKDKTTATLTIVVKDLAGNEKTETHQFFINQESDKPRFTAQNFDIAVTTEAELDLRVAKKKQNTLDEGVLTNMFSTSQVMKYTVEDDDGVKETKVKVGNGALQDADGFTLPDGKSQLTFYVYDTNYDSSKDATYNANYVYSFTVWVLKGQAPTVDIISTPDYVTTLDSNVASDAKKTFTVTGTVSGVGEYTLSYQDPDANNPGTHRIYYKLTSQEDTSYTEVSLGSDGLYHLYPEPAQGQTVEEAYKKSITWKDEFTPHNGSTSGTVQYTINGALNSTDKEFNFRVDSGRPTITFDAESVQAAGSTIYSTSYRFNGKAADSGISGLTKVEIQFTNKGGSPDESKWMAADGTGDWYKNIYFANGEFSCFTTQSEKTIHVRAKDGAGNYSTIYTKDFKYDTEYPTITINNKPNGYLPKGSYSLTGYITEKYGITSGTKLVVKEYLKVGSNYQLQDSAHDITITKGTGEDQYNYSWAMSIPFVSNLSGDLKYTFTISDANGNPLNADELLLTRDIVDPVVVISSPSSNTFGINSISGTSATLSGTVKEKDKDKLYYQIKSGTTAADSNWIEYDISDLANETDTWRVPVQLETTEYPDGKYTLYVKAKDKAGNESTAVSQAFSIDRADPVVKVKVMKREGTTSSHVEATLTGSSTIKVASGTGYDIQIEATDDSGIQSIKLYDITTPSPTEVSLKDQANEKITNTPITTEGTKSYKVIVKDKSGNGIDNGKTVEKTISVIYDKSNPTASITTIANDNDWISGTGKVYISGAATDNSGIKSITMSLDDGTASTEKSVPVANPWTYELDCSNLTENTNATDSNYKLVLTVEDNCEKKTTVTRYFKLDKTTPVIKNLSVKNATTGAFTTSIKNVKAIGLAFDGVQTGYRPVIVTIEAKNASGTQADIGGTNKVITVATTSTQNTDFGKFNQAVATNNLADGEYTFTIKATDYAGNTAEQEAVITVDNTPPTVTTPTLDDWNDKHSSAKINVTFTDVNPDAVYYYVNDYSSTTITAADKVGENDWTVMTLAETTTENQYTASKSHSFADGHGVVYVKVVDKAGNISYGTTAAYEVDTKAPDICTLDKVDEATLNGSKLINGLNDVTFTVNASDYNDNNIQSTGKPKGNDVTRVASVELTKIGTTTYTGNDIVNGKATLTNGTTGSKTGEWTIIIPKAKFNGMTTGSYPVTVTVADTKGNKKDFQLFTLDVDQGKPEIKSYALSSSYDAGVVSSVQTFYMNNKKAPFTLTGIAKDDREIEEVKLTIKKGSDTVKELTSSDSAWTFTSENTAAQGQASNAWTSTWSGLTGSVTVELSVKDKALNPEEPPTAENKLPPLSFKIIFDTTAPVGLHAFDKGATPKDIYFRVGDQDRDDGSTTAANGTVTWDPEWSDALDKDVGGKYTSGTFGNKETIKIRGNFTENGSGVKMIYYKLFTEAPSADDITNLKNSPASYADGYFAPKSASETKRRVFYTGEVDGVTKNGTSGSKNYVEISSTYLTTISGFQEGNNYLVLVAEDNVGNTEVDTVSDAVNYYTINVDTLPPETTALTENLYSNKTEDLTLSFTVEDKINKAGVDPAGIKKVIVNIQGVANTSKDKEATLTNEKYEVTIPKADLPGVTGQANSYSISVTTVDKAGKGNTDTRSVGNLVVDLKAPDLEIGVISDAKVSTAEIDVNGKLSISGTSSDETKLGKVEVSYKKKTGEDTWHDLTVTGTNNWSTTFDTKASGVTDNTVYAIRAIATDSSGNQATATSDIMVNQNTDRPTVKFTNLTKENIKYILKYISTGTLEGTVSDDDGTSAAVVTKFLASTSPISNDTGWTENPTGTWTHSTYGTTVFSKTTGDFKFTPTTTADGPQDVYFYIKDNKGNEFYSMAEEQLERPHQQWKDEVPADDADASALHYEKDSTAPRIQDIKVQAYNDSNAASGEEAAVTAATKLGGTSRQKAEFKIKAYDENGIDEIRLTLNYKLKTDAADAAYREYKITTKATHDGFANSGSVPGTGDYIWTTGKIDVSTWKSDNVTGTIEAFDKNGLQSSASPVFFVDNDGPSVTVNSPSSTEELTGTQKFAGISTDSGSGITETAWIIPTAAQRARTDAQLAELTWDANYNGTTSASSWEFELPAATLTNNIGNATVNNEGVYTIPFYVKATDALGNYTINRTKTIKYNPEGDRPKTKITYPNDSEYSAGNNYLTLGGAIRITGTAEIPSGTTTVRATYLQVIQGTGNSTDLSTYTTTSAYVSSLKYNNNPCYSVHTASQAATNLGFTNLNFATGVDSSKWWGIKVNNAASWNFTINNNGEMNPDSGTTNYVAIRACAVNEDGKVGTWTDWYYINIDNTAPTQEAFMYQFTTAPASGCTAATILANTNIKASNSYSSGMYLKGSWYLTVKLDDESAINSYEVKKGVDTLAAGTGYYASTKVSGSGNNNQEKIQYLFIPVDTSNPAVTYTVTVNDTEHSISKTYSLNIDNQAPVIESVYKGETYNVANVLNTTENKITDSNYIYTLGSSVEETASGFDRFVFYYVRAGTSYTTPALLDPLITSGTSAAKVALRDLTARTVTQGSTNYTLYAKSVTGTLGADGYTFTPTTAAEITGNAHIRKGGLIEANGVLRKIEGIADDGVVTFDTSSGVTAATSGVTVYFPYAQVVDNTGNESTTNNTGSTFVFKNNSDDGDGMPESVEGSKTTGYTLTSTIHSKNMPDGPCALVVLAFDKAGNVSGNTYPVKIENSAPRLAKVWLGTDLNSSESWQSNEFVGYDLYTANDALGVTVGGVKETQSIHTSGFKIKDKLAVIAEIVGGNGDIMMVYGKDADNANPVAKTTGDANVATVDNAIAIAANATDRITTVTYNSASASTSLKGFTLTSQQVAGLAANATITSDTYDGTKQASFTFWDQTDELTQGTNSQNCVLHVDDFIVDLYDGVEPNVVINPFHWTSLTDNNIYGSESAQKLSDLQGHVELESNWTALADDGTTKLTSWDGKEKNKGTALDSDPKVSGKIVVRGTAYDDKVINTLQFSMTNFDSGETKTFATYNSGSDSWTISKVGTPAADPTMAANYYEVTVTPDYLDQNGHKVNWEIAIDTSHLSDVAHIDAAFTVTALDKAGGSSADRTASETAVDATMHRPTYYMDVVPYITGLDRPSAKTNTNRSRRGKYQVVLNEQIDITGFNLPGTATDTGTGNALVKNGIKLQKTGDKAGAANETAIAVTTGDDITNDKSGMSFKAPATSGYIKAYTNNIPSINNYNIGNEMESEYSGDEWTDDVYLSVWKNDEYFYYSNDPISPSMDKVPNAGKKQHRLYGGWGTQGSRTYASYANTTGTGSSGNAPNPTSGEDAPNETSCQNTTGNNNGYGDPISYYDVATDSDGNRYNVIVDCWQGSGGGWGRNFVINKNGHSSFNGQSGTSNPNSSEDSMKYVIERMGAGGTNPDSADSSDGFDEMFNQFLNVRIAVSSTGEAYITYYDRYAKCLKWAMAGNYNGNNPRTKYATEGIRLNGAYSGTANQKSPYYKNGGFVVAGYDTLQTGGTLSNLNVGLWSDIAVESASGSGKPVIAYYDTTNRRLMIATSAGDTYPVNTNSPVVTGTATSPTNGEGDGWNRQVVTGSAALRLGEYVSLALDGGNNIHMACKGAKESCLYYVYGARTAYGTYNWTTVCVDNNGSPGTWTDIKLTDPSASGAAAGPVISYYDPTNDATEDAIKVAILESTTSNAAENWDNMTVPCNTPATANRITLALDVTDGKTYSATGTSNNSDIAIGYVSSRFDCVYLRKE